MASDVMAVNPAADTEEPHRDSVLDVMAASMIGTAIEFYDNCYSIAAASYFGLVFFMDVAKSNPFLATLLSFVTFAVSFLARPFGSLLFGHFGDRLGREQTPCHGSHDDGNGDVCRRRAAGL